MRRGASPGLIDNPAKRRAFGQDAIASCDSEVADAVAAAFTLGELAIDLLEPQTARAAVVVLGFPGEFGAGQGAS